MKKYLAHVAIVMSGLLCALPAAGQDVSVGELKAKGAVVLSEQDVKGLLTGAQVRYENVQNETQMKLNADGSLQGVSKRRIGGRGAGTPYSGSWNINDQGRWCAETQGASVSGGSATFCRDILKLGDKYYYAGGNAKNDARTAVEMTVSK